MSLLKRKFGEMPARSIAISGETTAIAGRAPDARGAGDRGPDDRAGSGQRIRVGLTGLAAIFLLVLIAAAGLRPDQSRVTPETTSEPLAVLGVAPGAGPAGADDSVRQASARPAPAAPALSAPAPRPPLG
jgi:hypothetical protein